MYTMHFLSEINNLILSYLILSIQLYKLYHKNTNNLLPSYFNSFTPPYYDVDRNHDLRYADPPP